MRSTYEMSNKINTYGCSLDRAPDRECHIQCQGRDWTSGTLRSHGCDILLRISFSQIINTKELVPNKQIRFRELIRSRLNYAKILHNNN